jgi:hypothetical protein
MLARITERFCFYMTRDLLTRLQPFIFRTLNVSFSMFPLVRPRADSLETFQRAGGRDGLSVRALACRRMKPPQLAWAAHTVFSIGGTIESVQSKCAADAP